ncbi:MAG: DUF3604 domain-containing protein [Pseudomonadota bacterium]
MIKKVLLSVLLGVVGLSVFLAGGYLILSSINRDEIDKTIIVSKPKSEKSLPEEYAFGYQPSFSYTEERERCAVQYPNKKAFFGDLHIHTALSADAFPDGTRTYPDDVYAFAKGAEISLPTPTGGVGRKIALSRPLDFASVTDHAETFGEGYICRIEGAFPGYETPQCQKFRRGGEAGVRVFMTQNSSIEPSRNKPVCGEDGKDCSEADKLVWQEIIASAEKAYDRSSDCSFTSFVGYEYTRSPNAQHMHRNMIFRNTSVPEKAASFFDATTTYEILSKLEIDCRQNIENCDVLSIPHNSNISGGNAFNLRETEGLPAETVAATRQLRGAFDRLVELMQHKGASECLNGANDVLGDVDELCDVEAMRQFGKQERAVFVNRILPALKTVQSPECTDDNFNEKTNQYEGFCLSSRDFARGALLEGMGEEGREGVNPYEFGFIASTDTHLGAAGATDEASFAGHIAYETELEGRLGEASLGRFNRLLSNPGGLAGVYAVENSRDALFHSMKRREAFGTSGPRIEPRFFIGRYNEDICSQDNWLEAAYEFGTPMGSRLPSEDEPFGILAQATRDALSGPLQKLQLVKGWIDADGQKNTSVIDLQTSENGADALCALYTDDSYSPDEATYYYLRTVETPSPRWSKAQCDALTEDEKPEVCSSPLANQMTVEMAWSSPIWLMPTDNAATALIDGVSNSHMHQ